MATDSTAAARVPVESIGANGAVGIPRLPNNVFSWSRSCETSSAAGDGYTGTCAASVRAAAAGTFSNS